MATYTDEQRQDQWRMIFGSSGEMWEWWRRMEFHDGADWDNPGHVSLTIEDPDDESKTITKRLTPAKVFAAFEKACNEIPSMRNTNRQDPDLDASSADVVLQMAVLGEVVYG